ncbi:MAG TPA: hypothetical protein VF043_13335 [Ktedonobacteraceae bacterium]
MDLLRDEAHPVVAQPHSSLPDRSLAILPTDPATTTPCLRRCPTHEQSVHWSVPGQFLTRCALTSPLVATAMTFGNLEQSLLLLLTEAQPRSLASAWIISLPFALSASSLVPGHVQT